MIALLIPLLMSLIWMLAQLWLSVRRETAELDRTARPLAHPALTPVIRMLARALDQADLRVHLLDSEEVNGIASYDGRIFLTQGFLSWLDRGQVSPEELAAVIAHELGHLAHGHIRRQMIDVTGQGVAGMMIAGILGRFLPVIGPRLVMIAQRALVARLSRRDEFEADAWASALLIKSGIGTAPQKSLFLKLDQLTQRSSGLPLAKPPGWLLSHPLPQERIRAIEENEARWRVPARLS